MASMNRDATAQHHVVVVGGGFGGAQVVDKLRGAPVRITLIDQRNHHLFQPLLYQVATTILATSEIAWPIRTLLRDRKDVTTLLARVDGVDAAAREVRLDDGTTIAYDSLVLATGARHAYFGNDQWEPFAPGLKTLEDATRIRRRILLAFEEAEREPDPAKREALLTFCVIGGGPTGIELVGQLAEIANRVLWPEFRNIDTRTARIMLIEAGPRLLAAFPEDLSAYAKEALEKLGVEVRLGTAVTNCSADGVTLGETLIPCRTAIWAAGVAASPAARWLDAKADRAGRVLVEPDLSVPSHPDIFVIGDTASILNEDGRPVPGVAPAAKQQGAFVAQILRARLSGAVVPQRFRYRNQGSLATIGRGAGVADFGRFKLKGTLAWWAWGLAHIYFLIGMRNRFVVALNWLWIYLSEQHSARLITQGNAGPLPKDDAPRPPAGG